MWRRKALAVAGVVIGAVGVVPGWRDECVARLVHSSSAIDTGLASATKALERLRAMAVLGLLTDDAIERLVMLRYRNYTWYVPSNGGTWPKLFGWEDAFLKRYLPDGPSRVLIGGAGAGREAYHVATRGHHVVAFDPIPAFVEIMVSEMPTDLSVDVYQARYQDLPRLSPATPSHTGADLSTMPHFDAAILGWSSFSNMLDESECIQTLQTVARHVDGPILFSVFSRDQEAGAAEGWLAQLQARLPGRNSDPTIGFEMYAGVFRQYTATEIFDLCTRAGLSVIDAYIDTRFSPHSYLIVEAATSSSADQLVS